MRSCHEHGLPVVAPDIQVLYKSKPPQREKDEQDFRNILPHLDMTSRTWLAMSIARQYPDHPWLANLSEHPDSPGIS